MPRTVFITNVGPTHDPSGESAAHAADKAGYIRAVTANPGNILSVEHLATLPLDMLRGMAAIAATTTEVPVGNATGPDFLPLPGHKPRINYAGAQGAPIGPRPDMLGSSPPDFLPLPGHRPGTR